MTDAYVVRRCAHPTPVPERDAILRDPGYGRFFTDHMAIASWTADIGWHAREIVALEPIPMHPAAAVLHYAEEIFEGLKAYRHADGSVWLFRPERNARRFDRSARRMALPPLGEQNFLASLDALIRTDEPWVPTHDSSHCLYVRPFMFATDPLLGVRPPQQATYTVIASPSAPLFGSGVQPITLWISAEYTRAAPGGTGAAKCGGNYAAGLAAQVEAHAHGCDQALYLDSAERRWLEEAGTMNICLITSDRRLLTPSLGTILDGVTRDTVLALAPEHGLEPVECRISLDELRAGCADGTITEAFAVGTAAVVTPITGFRGDAIEFTVADGGPGTHALDLREHILDIQFGLRPDTRGWLHRVV
ncbi:MAG TPA: branched-chain amino acid aminotransferase [Aldersonia sp.]